VKAILSVCDKSGLLPFAQGLAGLGFEIYSTGGTQRALAQGGLAVSSVSQLTGFPEILEGRVKTLHPAVHGGILARRDLPEHMAQLEQRGIATIDLVAVNLYPFGHIVSRPEVSLEDALENIDIGGPTLIRASAKNFPWVLVVVDPADYEPLLAELRKGEVGLEYRRKLAHKAFQHTASYDTVIAQYLRAGEAGFPEEVTIALKKRLDLRYGENPHQRAALYQEQGIGAEAGPSLLGARQLGGPELSFNNILDLDAALAVVSEFAEPTVAIIKHTNPCGLASHPDLAEAYRRALAGDPVAAFGGIVATNRPIDGAAAQEIVKTHYDAIIAPDYEAQALELLLRKSNLRLLTLGLTSVGPTPPPGLDLRRVRGGLLAQNWDAIAAHELKARTVTKRQPTEEEWRDLVFAWHAVKLIKSNAIVLVKGKSLVGMGAGQPSRVVSVELALDRAGEAAQGSVLGSDAFFPFPDGVELAARGGVSAIIQPGGSVRDQEVIEAADKYNMAMVFTGARHFKH